MKQRTITLTNGRELVEMIPETEADLDQLEQLEEAGVMDGAAGMADDPRQAMNATRLVESWRGAWRAADDTTEV